MFKIKNITLGVGMLVVACEPAVAFQMRSIWHKDFMFIGMGLGLIIALFAFIFILGMVRASCRRKYVEQYGETAAQYFESGGLSEGCAIIAITPKEGMSITVNGKTIKGDE